MAAVRITGSTTTTNEQGALMEESGVLASLSRKRSRVQISLGAPIIWRIMVHKLFIAKNFERLKGFIAGAKYLGDETEFPVDLSQSTYKKVGDLYIVQVDVAGTGDDEIEWIPIDSTKCSQHDL